MTTSVAYGYEPSQTAIIMNAGQLTMETFRTKDLAVAYLRRWYARQLRQQDATDRAELMAEFGAPATATVAQISAFFGCWDNPTNYWCDVVPVDAVLNRIAPTLLRLAEHDHAALVLADGHVDAQPCASYDQALAALRSQATAWEHDDPALDLNQASLEELVQAYSDGSAGQWLGIMPILATDDGPAVLVPIDRLPAEI